MKRKIVVRAKYEINEEEKIKPLPVIDPTFLNSKGLTVERHIHWPIDPR